ncbi:hypothetical protein [Sporosarcina sp. FSL K6-3457]|uniref:hypothetical protein n=1 Tax=Sporosarcina sp. FSL K6-3457 TaxID=2978204 RepID=UPI0030FA10AF
MKENQWMYNSNEEVWLNCNYFDTEEEAIRAGKEYFNGTHYRKFFVGQVKNLSIGVGVDAGRVLEDIAENVYGEVGEVAGEYLRDVHKEHLSELEELLNDVLHYWMDNYDYKPKYFRVDNVECVSLGE